MNSYVERNFTKRPVKNLGWLLRNWQSVKSFEFNYHPSNMLCDGQLIAYLHDGGCYVTDFSCVTVLWNFLSRPIFKTLSLTVTRNCRDNEAPTDSKLGCIKSQTWQIGSPGYEQLRKLAVHGGQESYRAFKNVIESI